MNETITDTLKLKNAIRTHIGNLYASLDDDLDDFQLGIVFGLKTALSTIEIFEELN